jgi:putative Mg2+ transporter-C (MgtC) family protein
MEWQHLIARMHEEWGSGIVASALTRLILAAILGGLIGLERQLKRRAAGLRTNMFICFGSALFTYLSARLAGVPDAARIAAQIIPGIGFIGAGTILHSRGGLTSGLTTAATIFVVASVGMAAGGGLYLTAMFATGLVLLSLLLLGQLEEKISMRLLYSSYEVTGPSVEEISNEVNRILESEHRMMQNVITGNTGEYIRLQFEVEGRVREREEFLQKFKASKVLRSATYLGLAERE